MHTSSPLSVTEQRNPASKQLDRRSIPELVALFDREDQQAVAAVEQIAPELCRTIERVVECLRAGGRLFYVGAGTSGRLGVLDASECPPTFGSPPSLVQGIIAGGDAALRRSIEGAEDHPEDGADAVCAHGVVSRDFVLGIAASGRTPYVIGALEEAHAIGASTGLLSCTPPEEDLARFVDHFLTPIVGPEIVTGSTRLKAGSATKLILNRITTIAMIRLGKVYGNLMVDVQAWNEKLVERAKRIIATVAGVDRAAAAECLERAEGSTKLAIVMCKSNLDKQEAERLLDRHDGFLGRILKELER